MRLRRRGRAASGTNEPAGTKQGAADIQPPLFHGDITHVLSGVSARGPTGESHPDTKPGEPHGMPAGDGDALFFSLPLCKF